MVRLDGEDIILTGAQAEGIVENESQFISKIATAKADGMESIEASPEIIAKFNKGNPGHFIYHGIKVFPYGTSEDILSHENEQMGKRLHGNSEGTLDNR